MADWHSSAPLQKVPSDVQGVPLGSPRETAQEPPSHESPVVQSLPSSQALPLGSDALQALPASLQVSLQSPSPSGPSQGLPGLTQVADWHSSAPLQKVPSDVQAVPSGSLRETVQAPALHVSPVVHSLPSSQTLPLGSGAVQESVASSQLSLQSPSPSDPAQRLPLFTQVPDKHVSRSWQKRCRADRQVLGDPLDEAKNDRLPDGHPRAPYSASQGMSDRTTSPAGSIGWVRASARCRSNQGPPSW